MMAALSPAVPGEKEEKFLENYFTLISQFAYDKAKDFVDKERELHKPVFGSSWGLLVYSLSQLAVAEKTYMSLGFLEQRGFFTRSKDTLKTCYQNLLQEFRRVEETVSCSEVNSFGKSQVCSLSYEFEQLLGHICGQLCNVIIARQELMNFYEQVHIMGMTRNINFVDLVIVITETIKTHSKNFHHPLLAPIKSVFGFECDILNHLLQAQILMSEWKFLPSLLQLHQAHTKLTSWGSAVQLKEPALTCVFGRNTKKSAFSSKHSSWPVLYQWLMKFKCLLVSKFTIFFHDILQKQTTPQEMKSLTAKASDDFTARIINFQKKTDAVNVSLVFDMQGLEDRFTTAGYVYPNRVTEVPTGLDSFPAIYSCPGEKPSHYWPMVVMLISDQREEMATHVPDKVQCLYDKSKHTTYFLTQVDTRITLVVIFESKKSEKDSYINNFMTDIGSQLRCAKIFTGLKAGSK